ncbi:transposase [Neobacillus sp. DY30]|uniref:transposase n=1 Tax=Neobacillus sp. DY30 TaxID=3047871 RepID=UPI0024BF6565|nr:transposase [Neobacillus sp. DY30]WHY01133.1 transposase [Neobacillus sp. DY30]
MPRKARKKSCTGIYHIMLRGINKQTIFEQEEDKSRFLETIKKYKEICRFHLYGYCLMDNHIHLLVKETEESISQTIKRISSSYVYWYNLKYERAGHLFQERFKSEGIDTQTSFLRCLRYIHQNPLKAGLAQNVFHSQWTSLNEYINGRLMVDIDIALNLFSNNRKTAIRRFSEFMNQLNNDQFLEHQERVRLTDEKVKDFLIHQGIKNISDLQQMEREDRNAVLTRVIQQRGVSIRQLSRITGISKGVIERVTKRVKIEERQ